MVEHIEAMLADIEAEHGVQVLYACEAGSRAWGFASATSDYDVRFIFVHPRQRYLQLDDPRDTIERMHGDDLDFAGWDLRKALRLLRKSNPMLIEWLLSPIVYRRGGRLCSDMLRIIQHNHAPLAVHWHYLQMARGNFAQYIQHPSERGETVLTKKYLYVVNPLAKLLYFEHHHALPPLELEAALAKVNLPADVRQEIDQLIALKREGWEIGRGPASPVLNAWLVDEMARLAEAAPAPTPQANFTPALDALFARVLRQRTTTASDHS